MGSRNQAGRKRRAIVLANPPDCGVLWLCGFPGALLYLKAWLTKLNPEASVEYLDLSVDPVTAAPIRGTRDAVAEQLSKRNLPDGAIYALTSTTATYQNALQTAAAIKNMDPSAVTVLGGHHASHEGELILEAHAEIDYCCTGEGEHTLGDMSSAVPIAEVRGLMYRFAGGVSRNAPARTLSRQELDCFEFDDFDFGPILRNLGDARLPSRYLDLTIARGCNLGCTFCAFGEDKLRDMSAAAKARILSRVAASEVYRLAEGVNIHDNDFSQNIRRTHELCDILLNDEIDLKWTIQTRAEHLNERNEDLVEKLAAAGCDEVYLGVESFDPETACYLKNVTHAGAYLRSVDEAVNNLVKYGVTCNINLQLGVPSETAAGRANEFRGLTRIAELAAQSRSTAKVRVFPQLSVAYPGTLMARSPIRGSTGRLRRDSFERYTRQEWEQVQQRTGPDLAVRFGHGNGGIPLGIIDADRLAETGEVQIEGEKYADLLRFLADLERLLDCSDVEVFNYEPYVHA